MKKIFLALLIVSFSTNAKDYGVIGVTYPIAERDMIELMQERMRQKVESGEVAATQRDMVDRARKMVARPQGIKLPRAQVYKSFEMGVSYKLPNNILDSSGKVLFWAGTTINPLDVKSLTQAFCFVDGDDDLQISWLRNNCADPSRYRVVLVNGNYLDVSARLGRRIYFDQRSYLTNRFGLQALPTIVSQKGKSLNVEEIAIK